MTVSPDVFAQFGHRDFFAQTSFAIEFICVADDFLLQTDGTKVLCRNWEVFPNNLLHRDAGSGMSLGYERMFLPTFSAQQFGPQKTVLDVFMLTYTEDSWCRTIDDTNVVKHRCFLDELPIYQMISSPLRVSIYDRECAVGYLPTMGKQHVAELRALGIIFIDKTNVIH